MTLSYFEEALKQVNQIISDTLHRVIVRGYEQCDHDTITEAELVTHSCTQLISTSKTAQYNRHDIGVSCNPFITGSFNHEIIDLSRHLNLNPIPIFFNHTHLNHLFDVIRYFLYQRKYLKVSYYVSLVASVMKQVNQNIKRTTNGTLPRRNFKYNDGGGAILTYRDRGNNRNSSQDGSFRPAGTCQNRATINRLQKIWTSTHFLEETSLHSSSIEEVSN